MNFDKDIAKIFFLSIFVFLT